MRIPRALKIGAGVIAIAGIVGVAVWPDTLDVDVAPVVRAAMDVTIDEDGETRIHDRYVISAPVTGRLQRIALEPGDRVERGATVIRIAAADAPLIDARASVELQAAAEAAREAVAQARSDHERAAAALERARAADLRLTELVNIGAVSREEFETGQTARRTATIALQGTEHAVTRAEREWQVAQARLSRPANRGGVVTVAAPVSGVVLKRLRESECVVAAGEPLLELGDPSGIEVVADLLSTDAVRVKPGSSVTIERWGGPTALRGHVRLVEPSGFLKISALGVEEQRVNVIVDFDDPAAASRLLGDGYRVEVRVSVWQHPGVLTLPVGALFRRGNAWAVFVADGGRSRLQPLELGERNNDVAEIRGGLNEGERVILHPSDRLDSGARIRVRH